MTNENFSYVLIGNIPSKFHSVDLRSFFSTFIEAEKFECFHFRHRPEVLKRKSVSQLSRGEDDMQELKGKTTCCVVSLKQENVKKLLELYNGENWTDKGGKSCPQKAVISRISIRNPELYSSSYMSKKEIRACKREHVEFVMEDLVKLSELNPPSFMPNGNVGTSLNTFLDLIRSCQLPPQVIKKLGLSFPVSRSKNRYGNVSFDYGNIEQDGISLCANKRSKPVREVDRELVEEMEVLDSCGQLQNQQENLKGSLLENYNRDGDNMYLSGPSGNNLVGFRPGDEPGCPTFRQNHHANHGESSDSEPEEDWERHEALHDDVDCQGRTKERLFENEIELKWEKGGSGLVFYTDAAYWDSLNGDFDEQTADDWDVDMGIYEKGGCGDRNSRALLEIRLEEERRLGIVDEPEVRKIGDFEKHTKGFGGRIMKIQGWTEGSSLGGSQSGITEPIPTVGQLPYCKIGLGYYGEKLERRAKRPKVDRKVVISTVFDNKANEKKSTPWQSAGPFTLKYRDKVDFVSQSCGQ